MGIIAGLLVGGVAAYVQHIETKFNYYDTTRVGLFADVAALKSGLPVADRRLESIETQLIQLNRSVAELTALARERRIQ